MSAHVGVSRSGRGGNKPRAGASSRRGLGSALTQSSGGHVDRILNQAFWSCEPRTSGHPGATVLDLRARPAATDA